MLYEVIHSSQAPTAPDSPDALGFLYNHGGLNNQKMAIAGLLLSAIEQRKMVNLPYLYVKDQRSDEEYLVKFQDVFEAGAIADFARRYKITINAGNPSGLRGGWDYFSAFGGVLAVGADRTIVEAALDASLSLQPRITSHPIFLRLKHFVFASLGVQIAIQLRIERDWDVHAEGLRTALGDTEDYAISFVEILTKVKNAFPDVTVAYATSDEKSMPASKDEIRAFARSRFGINLLWKSDLLGSDLEQLTPLDLSIIDFEIAKYCRRFVGLSASTFANLLCLEKFAKTRADVKGQFIYNCLGDVVMERNDNGFSASAHVAVLPSRVWDVLSSANRR